MSRKISQEVRYVSYYQCDTRAGPVIVMSYFKVSSTLLPEIAA